MTNTQGIAIGMLQCFFLNIFFNAKLIIGSVWCDSHCILHLKTFLYVHKINKTCFVQPSVFCLYNTVYLFKCSKHTYMCITNETENKYIARNFFSFYAILLSLICDVMKMKYCPSCINSPVEMWASCIKMQVFFSLSLLSEIMLLCDNYYEFFVNNLIESEICISGSSGKLTFNQKILISKPLVFLSIFSRIIAHSVTSSTVVRLVPCTLAGRVLHCTTLLLINKNYVIILRLMLLLIREHWIICIRYIIIYWLWGNKGFEANW